MLTTSLGPQVCFFFLSFHFHFTNNHFRYCFNYSQPRGQCDDDDEDDGLCNPPTCLRATACRVDCGRQDHQDHPTRTERDDMEGDEEDEDNEDHDEEGTTARGDNGGTMRRGRRERTTMTGDDQHPPPLLRAPAHKVDPGCSTTNQQ